MTLRGEYPSTPLNPNRRKGPLSAPWVTTYYVKPIRFPEYARSVNFPRRIPMPLLLKYSLDALLR